MEFEGYCVKCRSKVKVRGEEVIKEVKGTPRRFAKGNCPHCGTAVWKVLGKA